MMISELEHMLAVSNQGNGYLTRRKQAAISFIGTTRTLIRCNDVPMKGNNMTNQNQPGQHQSPGQQQSGGQKPDQQSQAPAKGDKNPKQPHEQTSNTDT